MTFKKIVAGDPLFRMSDGLMLCNRAGFEIDLNCPRSMRETLIHAMQSGWIKPVAYLREDEYAWESLKE